MNKIGRMCLNWKVIAGLAVVGLGIWLLAPEFAAAALPLLLVAACPLSMLLMMRGMQGMQGSQCASQPQTGQVGLPTSAERTREEQLAELKAQLAQAQAQQEAIARDLAQLEAASPPAVRQAEAVSRAADQRSHGPAQTLPGAVAREGRTVG